MNGVRPWLLFLRRSFSGSGQGNLVVQCAVWWEGEREQPKTPLVSVDDLSIVRLASGLADVFGDHVVLNALAARPGMATRSSLKPSTARMTRSTFRSAGPTRSSSTSHSYRAMWGRHGRVSRMVFGTDPSAGHVYTALKFIFFFEA